MVERRLPARRVPAAAAVRRLPLARSRCAVAVAVALRLGQQRGQRARQRVDLVGGEHRAVDEVRLLLGQQPLEPEQQRELAPPLDRRLLGAGLDLGQRSVERPASGRAGGERVLERFALVDEPLACEQFRTRDRGRTRERGGITHGDRKVASGMSEPRVRASGSAARLRPGRRGLPSEDGSPSPASSLEVRSLKQMRGMSRVASSTADSVAPSATAPRVTGSRAAEIAARTRRATRCGRARAAPRGVLRRAGRARARGARRRATTRRSTSSRSPARRCSAPAGLLCVGSTAQFSRLAVRARRAGAGSRPRCSRPPTRDASPAARTRLVLHAQTYARGSTSTPATAPAGACSCEAGIEHIAMEKRSWRLPARRRRCRSCGSTRSPASGRSSPAPGRAAPAAGCAPAAGADRPATDPFAEGHEDRTPPELYAVRPGGGAPDTPGWTVRVVPNLYPALEPRRPEPPRRTPTAELFWAGPARGAHEVIVNSPRRRSSRSGAEPEQVAPRVDVWRERMRAHADAACVHLIVNERREAGASLPHTHAQLYALDFVPGGDRPRARALRRLRDPDDGRQPARRPRPGGGPPARADRRDRRRGGADGRLRGARARSS